MLPANIKSMDANPKIIFIRREFNRWRYEIEYSDATRRVVYQPISPSPDCTIVEAGASLEIGTRFSAKRPTYLAAKRDVICIGSELSSIVSWLRPNLNLTEIALALVHDEGYSFASSWIGLHVVPGGGRASISGQPSGKLDLEFYPPKISASFAQPDLCESLIQSIRDSIGVSDEIAVRFSGGVDSTSILFGARTAYPDSNIVAVTWSYADGSSHEDLSFAKKITKELRIEHAILEIDPDLLFSIPAVDYITPLPTTALAFCGVIEAELSLLSRGKGQNNLAILDGHGGDHIFFDPLPSEVILLAAKERGISYGIKKLMEYSRLTAKGVPQIIKEIALTKLRVQAPGEQIFLSRDAIEHINLMRKKVKQSKEDRYDKVVQQAIYQNSFGHIDSSSISIVHPFTTLEMMGAAAAYRPFEMFNESSYRAIFKRAMMDRYGQGIMLRNDKGHLTGAFQRALSKKLPILTELIHDGRLSKCGIINHMEVMKSIRRNAIGAIGVSSAVLKILGFELAMDRLARYTDAYI
ncbi:hypothetical protein LMG26411_05493 [Cupriavidus numazuensis]|uniref:Asparagine synthetase domain-containing protein n=1 Tax=Cupriavidus numazuensis TaxID=221992 RepID=A0ABM8TPX7_9BURK|nr:hypothetical protein LMG26411_05493 [Cupriavidus numazuensis]